jgi:3-dehydroquinate synthase
VAIGMIMANELSIELGFLTPEENERIKTLLKKYDLPTSFKIKDEEEFYEHFFADKKTMNNKIKFIIPEHIGKYKIVENLDKEIILKVLRKFK